MLTKALGPIVLILLFSTILSAQDTFTVLPQIADGYFPDGSYYRSTIMITPWFVSDAPQCSLRFYGLNLEIEGTGPVANTSISVPTGGMSVLRTTGRSSYQGGYGTLTCTQYVFANVLFALYAPNNQKVGEATVFGAAESFVRRVIADQREGAKLGLAIANNTDLQRTYRLTLLTNAGTTFTRTINVGGRRNATAFLDDLMPETAGSVGLLTVDTADFSEFSLIGLRFTGPVFTTIPAY